MKKLLAISLFAFAAWQACAQDVDFGVKSKDGGGPKRLFGKDDGTQGKKDLPPPDEANKRDIARETKVDSILASVNGEPVTLLDVLIETAREEARLAAVFTGERLYSETAQLRRKVVDEIVDRKLVYASYVASPFDIDKQFIENMVDAIALSMGDGTRKSLEKRSKAMGTSIDEIKEKAKERIAVDILLSEFCDRQVYITPKEVYDYYESHINEWITPEALELDLLLVRRDGGRSGLDAKEACATMAKSLEGADAAKFKALARSYSDGPNAANGGSMGAIERDRLRPEFEQALKNASVGTIAGPVETPEGFYFIRLASVSPALTPPFDKVEREIRRKLEGSAKELKRTQYIQGLKDKAIVRYYF
jgi:hypothetical protein